MMETSEQLRRLADAQRREGRQVIAGTLEALAAETSTLEQRIAAGDILVGWASDKVIEEVGKMKQRIADLEEHLCSVLPDQVHEDGATIEVVEVIYTDGSKHFWHESDYTAARAARGGEARPVTKEESEILHKALLDSAEVVDEGFEP